MAHIKLHERTDYEFTYEMTIQLGHLNYRRHLGHDSIVRILHEARANLFHTLGLDELDLGDGKTAVVTADMVVNYKSEGFMFDTLRIESHVDEMSPDGFRVFHRMTRDGQVVALAEVGLVGFDYATRAHVPIPATLKEALGRQVHLRQ